MRGNLLIVEEAACHRFFPLIEQMHGGTLAKLPFRIRMSVLVPSPLVFQKVFAPNGRMDAQALAETKAIDWIAVYNCIFIDSALGCSGTTAVVPGLLTSIVR